MAKEVIRFRGLSLNKDEQSAAHGELALCANVELHDGALRPSVLEGSMVTHEEGGQQTASKLEVLVSGTETPTTLLYVHETPSYRHFIAEAGGKLYWFKADGTVGSALVSTTHTPIHDFSSTTIISVNSVGNTLVVLAGTGVHYILWKEGNYNYLGTKIPFVELAFRPSENKPGKYDVSTLDEAPQDTDTYSAWRTLAVDPDEVVDVDGGNRIVYIKSGYKTDFTESVWALINQANNTIAKDGHFYAPFIIRYCYRLYDGSMVMHSAPVYIDVSSPRTYRVYFANAFNNISSNTPPIYVTDERLTFVYDGERYSAKSENAVFYYLPNNIGIRYSSLIPDRDNDALQDLKANWSDIVKSIDIFVSPSMAREKTGEQISKAIVEDGDIGVRDYALDQFKTDYWTHVVRQVSATELWEFDAALNMEFDIPLQDDEEYCQRLKDCSTFYKIKSFNIETDTIGTDGTYVDLSYDKSLIPNITSQEQMKDDYRTHNDIFPINEKCGMYVYNHRVNLYGMQERLFEGFDISTMINYWNTPTSAVQAFPVVMQQISINKIVVELTTEQGKKYVCKECGFWASLYSVYRSLLFYPDNRATKMTLYYETGDLHVYKKTLIMEPCNFLNGSMATEYFTQWLIWTADEQDPPAPTTDDTYPMPNKILTSEVDDPYFFPVEGRNSVGNGTIKGVAAVTRALSQGQVGSHDLQVFSTDGIWVLKVSETGTYSSQHNISREVCSNPKSICQLDQSVIFATERSLIKYRESDLSMISEVLDGPIPDWEDLLPTLVAAFPAETQPVIHKLLDFGTPAVQMFNKGSVFYDYASLRVVVLPAPDDNGVVSDGVALVYGLRDDAWSTMAIPAIRAVVPGYPSPFVQLSDGKVMILDKPYGYAGGDSVTAVPGLIISRTLTFSDTMDVIRGYTQYADCALNPTMYIFGSNDQKSWQSLGTSNRWFYNYMPGRPFRFFRIAIYMQMKPSEEYQQVEMEIVNKYAKL